MQLRIPELSIKMIIAIMNPSRLQVSSMIITLNSSVMVINIKYLSVASYLMEICPYLEDMIKRNKQHMENLLVLILFDLQKVTGKNKKHL